MKSISVKCALLLAMLLLLGSCSDEDNPQNPGGPVPLYFAGTVNGINGSLSGSIELTINGTAVTGSFVVVAPAAATHALTGTYNTTTRDISVTGGGYTFAGNFDGANTLDGTMSGTVTGTFNAVKDDSQTAIAFCGTFTGTDDGVWNFTLDGNTLSGSYTTTSGDSGLLEGTISGNNITINHPLGGAPLATGTRSGDNASGTWDNQAGDSGTWTGSRCN